MLSSSKQSSNAARSIDLAKLGEELWKGNMNSNQGTLSNINSAAAAAAAAASTSSAAGGASNASNAGSAASGGVGGGAGVLGGSGGGSRPIVEKIVRRQSERESEQERIDRQR